MKIKSKFLSTFVPIFAVSLAGLAFFAMSLFSKDKIAYVFSSTQDAAQMAAMLVQNQMQAQAPIFEMLTGNFDFSQKKFPEQSKSFLQLNENILFVQVEEVGTGKSPTVRLLDTLGSRPRSLVADSGFDPQAYRDPTMLFFFRGNSGAWGLSRMIKIKGYTPEDYRITVLFRKNPLNSLFEKPKYYDLFLVSKRGEVFGKTAVPNTADSGVKAVTFVQKNLKAKDVAQSQEVDNFLMTWTPIGNTNYGVVSVTQKSKVTEAIDSMKRTSGGVLALVLSIGLISVLILVGSLTKNIESLTADMKKFASGHLSTKSKVSSKDEIGVMSNVFNQMTAQIESLVSQTAAKARMEGELETARKVQQQFLPEKDYKSSFVEICGYCESASECGGDWWSYDMHENFCRVLIADVTGHGVAPAMLTAALHAAVAALRETPGILLEDFVKNLNKVIYASARGELVLSMFVAEIDFKTSEIRYVNASHCSSIIVRKQGDDRVEFLSDIGGPHLGRSVDSTYKVSTAQMYEGDRFIGYTDGLVEFANAQGRMFGEKKLVKILSQEAPQPLDLNGVRRNLLGEFEKFRAKAELPDDVTLVMFERHQTQLHVMPVSKKEIVA